MKPLFLTKASRTIIKRALENELKEAEKQLSRLSELSTTMLFWKVSINKINSILKQLEGDK